MKVQAIVLGQDKNGTVLFSREQGKMHAVIFKSHELARGAVLRLVLEKKGRRWCGTIEDVVHIPVGFACNDVKLFHACIEISWHFTQFEVQIVTVFDFWLLLYRFETQALYRLGVLAVLLEKLDIHPDQNDGYSVSVARWLRQEPVDILFQRTIQLSFEQDLKKWVLGCLSTHHQEKHFKTKLWLMGSGT